MSAATKFDLYKKDILDALLIDPVICLDMEGVDLCRDGKITIIQIALRCGACYLFDVNEGMSEIPPEILLFLTDILESKSYLKVIHDGRMDADALLHIMNIRLTNIHDTQACDAHLKHPSRPRNLNDTLMAYGCAVNEVRSNNSDDMYKKDPRIWEKRPLSPEMIEYASKDVISLFELYNKQIAMITTASSASDSMKLLCQNASEEYLDANRNSKVKYVKIHRTQIGRFIGKRGSNLRMLESLYPGIRFQFMHKNTSDETLMVYAKDDSSMNKILAKISQYKTSYVSHYY